MTLDFYHWSAMCPLNVEMLALLQDYENRLDIRIHDITNDAPLAKRLRMYYPTLTILNGQRRYYRPLDRAFLDTVCGGIYPEERPYLPTLGTEPYCGSIVPLTSGNCWLAGRCTGRSHCAGAAEKARFLEKQGLSIFGFLNLEEGALLGGVEFVPSLLVPYDIPRDAQTAFLTCVYLSDSQYDYKSGPLQALEAHLAAQYRRVLVISDEQGVFPNGDMAFFLRNGYTDLGIAAREDGYCTLHLLEKQLP